jgi:hypothetical protein
MAGSKNIYNTDPVEVLVEALEQSHRVKFQREYVDISVVPINGINTVVTISPKLINGFSPYVDPISGSITKLDLSQSHVPKDMCYSSSYPMDFTSLVNFMLASYGLLVKSGHWEIVHGTTVHPVVEDMWVEDDLQLDRFITLRPSVNHPLFQPTMVFRMMVTEDTIQELTLQVVGPEQGIIGQETSLVFQAVGGLEPYSYTIVEGTTPLPLNESGDGLEGELNATGRFDFTVEVEDSLGQTTQATGTMDVELQDFTITTGAPDGYVHEPYSFQYEFSGGLAPYSLVRVDSMPLGLGISDSGLLSGLPDTGDHQIRAIFKDALNTRFTLTDNIHVASRSEDVVREQSKACLVDWLELSAGYDPTRGFKSYPAGTTWGSVDLVHDNIRQYQDAAMKFTRGYVVKTSTQAYQEDLAVVLFVIKGYATMGGCLYSQMDVDSGLEVSVSDNFDTRLRIRAMINGQSYGFETGDVIDDSMTMITVQVAEGFLSLHRNEVLLHSMPIPTTAAIVTADNPITLGRRSNFTEGYQWNGGLARVIVFNKRLWGDQIAYLCGNGYGVSYRELQIGTELAGDYKITLTASIASASSDVSCDDEIVVSGATPLYPPLLIDGQLPSGVVLSATDLRRWTLRGIPSAPGDYISYWTAQGPQETAAIEVRIVVS